MTRVAALDDSGDAARWRVFLSHTSELRESRGGVVCGGGGAGGLGGRYMIVDMADFPAADQVPAQLCADRVRSCSVALPLLRNTIAAQVRANIGRLPSAVAEAGEM